MKPTTTRTNPFIYLTIVLTLSLICLTVYQFSQTSSITNEYYSHPHLEICRKPSRIHRGPSLIFSFNETTDPVLCPGDTFGDLNDTFIRLEEQECFLTMHHQGKILWSSKKPEDYDNRLLCAASLENNGNLVVYKEGFFPNAPYQAKPIIWPAWWSQTTFHPNKAEVRIRDQQLQIVHIFQDESERMFYIGEGIREFRENSGAPKQVAKEFSLKNHSDSDKVILRTNEYIGDLSGLHLILQTNCELQLNKKPQLLWSFTASGFKLNENCQLAIDEHNLIEISRIPDAKTFRYGAVKILPYNDFNVLQSNITFQGDRLLVIQTLKDGSEVTFYSEPGQDNGLKLKKELKQIGKNSLTIPSGTNAFIKRMEYIGDLDGLHLILLNNCDFILANGKRKLWKLQISASPPYMECFIQFNWNAEEVYGIIVFDRSRNTREPSDGEKRQIFGRNPTLIQRLPAEKFLLLSQLSLENNLMIMSLTYLMKSPEIYHAGLNTNGTWFQFLSDHALIVDANDKKDKIFPEMGYIGDIHGVFAILDKRGNLILFNETRPIWESGTTQGHESDSEFVLILTRDGNIAISENWEDSIKDYLWSTKTMDSFKKSQLSKSELLVNPDGMWLVKTYVDGTARKFKALEGTNRFALVDELASPLSQISK